MGLTLTLSVTLLVALLILRQYELRSRVRFSAPLRRALDAYALHALRLVRRALASDILMQGLHVVTYWALVLVRWIERRLVSLVLALRRFRTKQELREPSHKLAHVTGRRNGEYDA